MRHIICGRLNESWACTVYAHCRKILMFILYNWFWFMFTKMLKKCLSCLKGKTFFLTFLGYKAMIVYELGRIREDHHQNMYTCLSCDEVLWFEIKVDLKKQWLLGDDVMGMVWCIWELPIVQTKLTFDFYSPYSTGGYWTSWVSLGRFAEIYGKTQKKKKFK